MTRLDYSLQGPELFEMRENLHRIGTRQVEASFSGRSCLQRELARRMIDQHKNIIDSWLNSTRLSSDSIAPIIGSVRNTDEANAPNQSSITSLERPYRLRTCERTSPQSNTQSAPSYLQPQSLNVITNHEKSVDGFKLPAET